MAQEITHIIWVTSSPVYCLTYSPSKYRTKKSLAADICWQTNELISIQFFLDTQINWDGGEVRKRSGRGSTRECIQLETSQPSSEKSGTAPSLDPQWPHQKLTDKTPQEQQQHFTGNFSLQCFKHFLQASLSLEKDLKVT